MQKQTLIVAVACLLTVAVTSCKKSSSTTTTPTTPPTTTTSPGAPTLAVSSVDGTLVSIRLDVTTTAAGTPFTLSSEGALASFFTATGGSTMTDAGTVSVNTISVDKQTNNTYYKTASIGMTPATMNFSTGSNWTVSGAGSVPAFTYNHVVTFPNYTGTLADSINRSSGLTIALGSAVTAADSVIVLVAAGSKSVLRTVSGAAASVTFAASDLSGLPVVTDHTAFLEVVPYKITVVPQGSKHYAFIKEYAMVKNINIH